MDYVFFIFISLHLPLALLQNRHSVNFCCFSVSKALQRWENCCLSGAWFNPGKSLRFSILARADQPPPPNPLLAVLNKLKKEKEKEKKTKEIWTLHLAFVWTNFHQSSKVSFTAIATNWAVHSFTLLLLCNALTTYILEQGFSEMPSAWPGHFQKPT